MSLDTSDRMAQMRAAKAAKAALAAPAEALDAPRVLPPRYQAIRDAQARGDRTAATKRAQAALKGVILPDDSEPPFDPNPEYLPDGYVRVRCLPRGSDKISMGIALSLETVKFPKFQRGDEFILPLETARKYEGDATSERFGWVEILSDV